MNWYEVYNKRYEPYVLKLAIIFATLIYLYLLIGYFLY